MSKWWEISSEVCRDLLRRLIDRNTMHDGRPPELAVVFLTLEQARIFWSARCWMDVIAQADNGDKSVQQCLSALDLLNEQIKEQEGDERRLSLGARDLRALSDAEIFLDRYALTRKSDDQDRRRKRRGGKK